MRVRDKLNEHYLGKCAYCERDCKAEIEHYRPKKRVAEDKTHPGYYWLCYEWSNLLPSCHDCNTAGGKGSQFPIQGTRVASPLKLAGGSLDLSRLAPHSSPLIDEKPYLLHPEIDDPTRFLGTELDPRGEGVRLFGMDGPGQRGDLTIRICNLNRSDLKINRLRVVNDSVKKINLVFGLLADGSLKRENFEKALILVFGQMDDNFSDIHLEYTLLRQNIIATIAQFSALVLPLLEPNQQLIVQTAFEEYRQNNPVAFN